MEVPHREAREKALAEVPPRIDILKEDKLSNAVPEKLVLGTVMRVSVGGGAVGHGGVQQVTAMKCADVRWNTATDRKRRCWQS